VEIHAPRVGGDPWPRPPRPAYKHFNPRPPCGGRPLSTPDRWRCWHFNPRPPCGGRLAQARLIQELEVFQSTPPVWGATLRLPDLPARPDISIHAPRVGGDNINGVMAVLQRHFNPRPPCGGRHFNMEGSSWQEHFNPRPPCGGRLDRDAIPEAMENFNPRPPCGGRLSPKQIDFVRQGFQSTPPVWGATHAFVSAGCSAGISIHAPRVGGDGRSKLGGAKVETL